MQGITPSSEDFYATVVINSLMSMLKDSSLSYHHSHVIEAIMNIFKTLGLKCVSFLPQIIPGFIKVIEDSAPSKLESYFSQLSLLVSIVKQHIRNFLPQILKLIKDFWNPASNLQGTILQLIESISLTLEGEFKRYLAPLLPMMLQILEADNATRRVGTPVDKVLHTFLVFGSAAEEYMHLIIPAIVKIFDKQSYTVQSRKVAMETVARLTKKVNISDYAARIIHPLTRVIAGPVPELRSTAMDTLCALVFQLGHEYTHFIPMINKVRIAEDNW
jgi:serine/threonine-protein kinase mTOR